MTIIAKYINSYGEDFFVEMETDTDTITEKLVDNIVNQLQDITGDYFITPKLVKFYVCRPIKISTHIVIEE